MIRTITLVSGLLLAVATTGVAQVKISPQPDFTAEEALRREIRQTLKSLTGSDAYYRIHTSALFAKASVDLKPFLNDILPEMEKALKDAEPAVRRNAAAFAELQGPAAHSLVPSLIELLKDDEVSSRVNAASALAAMGRDAAKATPTLILLLKDADEDVRYNACRALAAVGPMPQAEAMDAFINVSNDSSADVRRVTMTGIRTSSLGLIGAPTEKLLDCLKKRMKDDSVQVRRETIRTIAEKLNNAKIVLPLLQEAIQDAHPSVQEFAADALQNLGEEAVPTLVNLIEHDRAEVRYQAVWALGFLMEYAQPSFPKLIARLKNDPDAKVRARIAIAFGSFRDDPKDIIPVLEAALKDADKTVRARAQETLDLFEARKMKAMMKE